MRDPMSRCGSFSAVVENHLVSAPVTLLSRVAPSSLRSSLTYYVQPLQWATLVDPHSQTCCEMGSREVLGRSSKQCGVTRDLTSREWQCDYTPRTL
jgi:hypothetical protein